jgi:hypothetical protein
MIFDIALYVHDSKLKSQVPEQHHVETQLGAQVSEAGPPQSDAAPAQPDVEYTGPVTVPPPPETKAKVPALVYHESDELLEPYKLAKNPYQWRGHSGVLVTRMPVIDPTGFVGYVPLPGLKFDKMISEHIAIYDVIVTNEESGDQLAVILSNSEPPKIGQAWRILVEGPLNGTSGLGAPLTITAVRFEGFYEPPPRLTPAQ